MKILLINKFYYVKGGSETVFFQTKKMLEKAGHDVCVFSMKDSRNQESPYSKYFVDNIDFNKKEGVAKQFKKALAFTWSKQAKQRLGQLIGDEKPEVAMIHNFTHQLTPSILSVLKKNNIRIIQTLHDYQVLSPNYLLYSKGRICPADGKFHWWNILWPKCSLETYAKTLLSGFEFYTHRLFKLYKEKVDLFITPSTFLKNLVVTSGIKNKIVVINNPIELERLNPNYEVGDYIVCVTRFSKEKGVMTLIKAVRKLPNVKLKIVGNGPLFNQAKEYLKAKQVNNVELLGRKPLEEVYEIVAKSKFLVIPSEWYENYPMVVLEAMALGKPVLGSNIGGIPEMVKEGQTGWLFKMGSIKDLRLKIKEYWPQEEVITKLGHNARQQVEQNNSSASYLQNIENVL